MSAESHRDQHGLLGGSKWPSPASPRAQHASHVLCAAASSAALSLAPYSILRANNTALSTRAPSSNGAARRHAIDCGQLLSPLRQFQPTCAQPRARNTHFEWSVAARDRGLDPPPWWVPIPPPHHERQTKPALVPSQGGPCVGRDLELCVFASEHKFKSR